MHELIEGLDGVEVIADDFLIVGLGETAEEATQNDDQNLMKFVQRCKERGVVLNIAKLQLHQKEVPFIGHVTKDKGLCVDPPKVRAIRDMPSPTDKAGVQRLLGLVQYLSKFLPGLANTTKPLQRLNTETRGLAVGGSTAGSNGEDKDVGRKCTDS